MLELLATAGWFLLPTKMKIWGLGKEQNYSFLREREQFHLYISKVRVGKKSQWYWGKKQNRTKNPLILQFHRGDQYFSLNENLLPSEMQMRLCCFSLLSTQRLTAFLSREHTSQASGAGNVIIFQGTEGASPLSD